MKVYHNEETLYIETVHHTSAILSTLILSYPITSGEIKSKSGLLQIFLLIH